MIKQFSFSSLVLVILHIKAIFCGQITGTEPILDFSNAGYLQKIGLKFNLDTQLTSEDFIKIIFPFPLHSELTASHEREYGLSIPRELYVTWQRISDNGTPLDGQYKAKIMTETVDSAIYFIQFMNEDYTIFQIPKSTWFLLNFNIKSDEARQLQKSNELLQLQIYTQSSVDNDAVIYDSNPSYNFLYLAPSPQSTLGLTVIYDDQATKNNLFQTQNVFLDTALNIAEKDKDEIVKLTYLLSDDSFKFTGGCQSVSKDEVPVIPALLSGEFECSIDYENNYIVAFVTRTALDRQNTIRIVVQIQSPKKIIQGVDVEVRLSRKYSSIINSIGSYQDAIKTNPIDMIEHQIYMGWGMLPEEEMPLALKIVRSDAEITDYHPFNSFMVKFRLNKDTPSDIELVINLFIKSETEAKLLKSSIIENLPAAVGKQVVCSEIYPNIPSARKISCFGVGALQTSTTYYIGFKMFFPFDVYETSIDCLNFGAITIQTTSQVQEEDNIFIVGRDKEFRQKMMKNQNVHIVTEDFIPYM